MGFHQFCGRWSIVNDSVAGEVVRREMISEPAVIEDQKVVGETGSRVMDRVEMVPVEMTDRRAPVMVKEHRDRSIRTVLRMISGLRRMTLVPIRIAVHRVTVVNRETVRLIAAHRDSIAKMQPGKLPGGLSFLRFQVEAVKDL